MQLLDIDEPGLKETVSSLLALCPKAAVFAETLDVTDGPAQEQAFARHAARYGRETSRLGSKQVLYEGKY